MVRPRFTGSNGRCSKLADHVYTTEGTISSNDFCGFYHISYHLEGIDGYILPDCPNGVDCYETTNNPNDAQCLKVRYSVTNNSFALMMESEVDEAMFASYQTNYKSASGALKPITQIYGLENAECLGYVFPNVDSDSDGIIDGMELVLGTDPTIRDTDGDTVADGLEYPLAGIPQSDPLDSNDPENPPCNTKECYKEE